ncbi:putative membrane protein [Campylobacter lari]|uniref:pentapeptide repeat-containing protein n=1 Tax=Campylobacter lari TaxID=201 RepID=UPI002152A7BF|nr:pentapeptide repeat-containing protein [Campylobacter lari]MCR6529122.1 pentapeptide repeat-containing protein [Campylobacter lari]
MEKNKIEELKKIGIYIDEINDNPIIKKYKLSIKNSTIKKIDFEKLQTTIKIIEIKNSEISNIHFAKENNIKIIFLDCIFKNQLAVRDLSFKEKIKIIHCIFENMIDFSRITFYKIANFSCSRFKSEIRFTQVNFLAQSNFQEVYFKSECYFSEVEFKERVSFFIARFRGEARFVQTKFLAKTDVNNTEVENNFKEAHFESECYFSEVEFKGRVSFYIAKFKNDIKFMQTKFLAKTDVNNTEVENNFIEAHFESECYFSEVEFKGKVSFAVSRFNGETLFANISSINNILEFNQVEFNRVKFVNTAERLNSYYFLNSTFKSIANFENLNINDLVFYNVVFENIVTFDKVNFDNKPNFENCTFSNQFNIEHKYIEYNFQDLQNRTNNITDKYKALLDARDLFRKLKSNRIAHHNLIDASEIRAQELYTRELELKYKENKSLKEKIERWQLFFYRKLCDHHTDILQSLNSLILVIGIFGVLNLAVIIGFNRYLGYKPILEHLYFSLDFYNHHINSTIQDNYLFMIVVNLIMLFAYLILVGFALCAKYIRKFFITISYVITLFIMITSPKILIPAMGIFTDKRVMLDPLSVLGGIYTIVFGFVTYSFIKTIRKNSIVPS